MTEEESPDFTSGANGRMTRGAKPHPAGVVKMISFCDCVNFKHCFLGMVILFFGCTSSCLAGDYALEKPFGMSMDDESNLYIAEIDGHCIAVLDKDFNLVERVKEIKGYGPLFRPFDVKAYKDRIYILDTGHSNVVVADKNWNMIYKIGAGKAGSAEGEFCEPHFLAVGPDGTLYVSSCHNHRIQKFDFQGKYISAIVGVDAGGDFPMTSPSGIAVMPDGKHLVIAEYGNHPPVITDLEGNIAKKLKSFGMAYGAYASKDRILVTSTYGNNVAVYSADGDLLFRIHSAIDSNKKGELNKPAFALADKNGYIIVNEWRNKRLQKFTAEGQFVGAYGGSSFDPGKQKIDFEKIGRDDSAKPVVLGAFTRVLSPAAVKKYHSYGISKLAIQPYNDLFSPNVKKCVDAAHELGMKIDIVFDGAWYGARKSPVHKTPDGKSQFANDHPQYYTLKRDGKTRNEKVLSWVYPEVRKFKVEAAVKAIQISGADGIIIDYIRWPAGHSDGHDPPAVKEFTEKYGVSPFEVAPTDPRWMKLRSKYITQFLCELKYAMCQLDRDVPIGVYVDADPERGFEQVGRDWGRWARMGIIDTINPMLYSDDYKWIYEALQRARKYAGYKNLKVSSTIDCYCGYLYNNQLMREGAWVSLLGGADEVVVCRDGAIERLNLFDSFKQITEDFAREAQDQNVKIRQ